MGQNGLGWHRVSYWHQFWRYPQLLSTSISEAPPIASESRKLGGIRRVRAVKQAASRHNIPYHSAIWQRRVSDGMLCQRFATKSAPYGPQGSFCGADWPPGAPGPNRCTHKLRFSPKVLSKSDTISAWIPPGVYGRAVAIGVLRSGLPSGLRSGLPSGLFAGALMLQLLSVKSWHGRTQRANPDQMGSAERQMPDRRSVEEGEICSSRSDHRCTHPDHRVPLDTPTQH